MREGNRKGTEAATKLRINVMLYCITSRKRNGQNLKSREKLPKEATSSASSSHESRQFDNDRPRENSKPLCQVKLKYDDCDSSTSLTIWLFAFKQQQKTYVNDTQHVNFFNCRGDVTVYFLNL